METRTIELERSGHFRVEVGDRGVVGLRITLKEGSLVRWVAPILDDLRIPQIDVPVEFQELRLQASSGAPLEGIPVEALRKDALGLVSWHARSDYDGSVMVPSHVKRDEVEFGGFFQISREDKNNVVELEPTPRDRKSDERQRPSEEPSLVVRVLSSETRKSVSDALVWIADRPYCSATTAESGEVTLKTTGHGRVNVAAARHARVEIDVDASDRARTVYLDPAPGWIHGRIVDYQGNSLEDALVTWPERQRVAVSDREGRFALKHLPELARIPLRVEKPSYLPHSMYAVARDPVSTSSEKTFQTIVLRRPWMVRGRILGSDGEPAPGLLVTVDHGREAVTTDARGRFRIRELPEGHWLLDVSRENQTLAVLDVFLNSQTENPLELGALMLPEKSDRLWGWVRDQQGFGLEDAEIYVVPEGESAVARTGERRLRARSSTSSSGYFELPALTGSAVQIEVYRTGFVPSRRTVSLDSALHEPIIFELAESRVLEGKVVDEGRSTPIQGARIAIEASPSRQFFQENSYRTSNAKGEFAFQVEADQRLSLRTSAPGYAITRRTVDVSDYERGDSLQIQLKEAAYLRGVALASSGEPLAHSQVLFFPGPEPPTLGTFPAETAHVETTATDGRFYFGSLAPGSHWLIVHASGEGSHRFQLDLRSGMQEREFRMPGQGRITIGGRAVLSSGEPAEGVELRASDQEEKNLRYSTEVGPGGDFLFEDLPSSTYRISASSWLRPVSGPLVVNAEVARSALEVVLEPYCDVYLTGVDQSPARKFFLEQSDRLTAVGRPYGSGYLLHGIDPGEWEVVLIDGDQELFRDTVACDEGRAIRIDMRPR